MMMRIDTEKTTDLQVIGSQALDDQLQDNTQENTNAST